METKSLVWKINADLHRKFKELCVRKEITMTEGIHEAIGYYVDVNGKLKEKK